MRLLAVCVLGFWLELFVCPITSQINALPQPLHVTMRVKMTAYEPYTEASVGQWAHVFPRRTATGTDAEKPGLAADFRYFPKGTFVDTRTPEFGGLRVDDTGGALCIDGNHGIRHLDVRMTKRSSGETAKAVHDRAVAFALQWREVDVYYPPGYKPKPVPLPNH